MKERVRDDEDLLIGLTASDAHRRLKSVRTIKNTVIGNKRAKTTNIQYLPTLLKILSAEQDPSVLVQAAQTVGSFAVGPEGAPAILELGGIPKLLNILDNPDVRVVEAAIRALKFLYKNPDIPIDDLFFTKGGLPRLVSLLSSTENSVSESAASVLARCCASGTQREAVVSAGAVPALLSLMQKETRAGRDAALSALAALTGADSHPCVSEVFRQPEVLLRLLFYTKNISTFPRTRFMACICLCNTRSLIQSGTSPGRDEVEFAILTVLIKLLAEPVVEHEACPFLLALMESNGELQAAAVDADIIRALTALLFLLDPSMDSSLPGIAGILSIFALLCSESEAYRHNIVAQPSVLPTIATSLTSPSLAVRSAACRCLRGLSRSKAFLRYNMAGVTDIPAALLELTQGDDLNLATDAAATLANIAVDYCVLKETFLSLNGIERFASLAQSTHRGLRLHGIWGLATCAYMAPPGTLKKIMQCLPWEVVSRSLIDRDIEIMEKTILLLRNLVHKTGASYASAVSWSNGQILSQVLAALRSPGAPAGVQIHALYVAVNVSAGPPNDKDAVIAGHWAPFLLDAFKHEREEVREAAIWVVLNLIWAEGDEEAMHRRLDDLKELGIPDELYRLAAGDHSMMVRERAASALTQLRLSEHGGAEEGEAHIPESNEEPQDDEESEEDEDREDYDSEVDVGVDLELVW